MCWAEGFKGSSSSQTCWKRIRQDRQAGTITMMSKGLVRTPKGSRVYQTKAEIPGGPELQELVPQYRFGMKVKGRNKGRTTGSKKGVQRPPVTAERNGQSCSMFFGVDRLIKNKLLLPCLVTQSVVSPPRPQSCPQCWGCTGTAPTH